MSVFQQPERAAWNGNKEERMKRLAVGSMIVALCAFFCLPALRAQDFPTKPITIVVPKEPGGAHDITARGMANVARKYLGQSMLIELKPGGGGVIGADFVAKSPADGYTILFGDSGVNSGKPAQTGRSKGPDEMAAVLADLAEVEPLLRASATLEVVTTKPVADVADAVVAGMVSW